jgi:serine/threonine-protein kinase
MKRWFKKSTNGETAEAQAPDVDGDGNGLSTEEDENDLHLTHVGPYEILAPIGKGGMGTVYKALDRKSDQTVAIKVLHRHFDLIKKRRKKDFLGREILIASKFRHENIIRLKEEIIEQEDSDGNVRRCLIMELVDGHNLTKHIADRDLTIKQMVSLCIKLCHGLDFLHQSQVIHRDFKPHNCLLSRDLTQIKICDFGLSKSTATWRTRRIKGGGGTPRYMSPEQLTKKEKVMDARSDIFSFGITMYELFTGEHPCNGKDSKEIKKQICSNRYKFKPPSELNPEIPARLDRIILKCLRRRPDKRYQSVTELLLDLTRVGQSRI